MKFVCQAPEIISKSTGPFLPLPRHPLSPYVFIQKLLCARVCGGHRNKTFLVPALRQLTAGLGKRAVFHKEVTGPSDSARGGRYRSFGGSREGNMASMVG